MPLLAEVGSPQLSASPRRQKFCLFEIRVDRLKTIKEKACDEAPCASSRCSRSARVVVCNVRFGTSSGPCGLCWQWPRHGKNRLRLQPAEPGASRPGDYSENP